MINDYIHAEYQDGGRGPDKYDCYGLMRAVRHWEYNKPLLPEYAGVPVDDYRSLTRGALGEVQAMKETDCRPGVAVLGWRGNVCLHVGVVVTIDNKIWVLETSKETGTRIVMPQDFAKRYQAVRYYD